LEIPTIDDVSVALPDGVEHNHSSPQELVESPKGSHEHVPHSSLVEHDNVHEVSVEFVQVQKDAFVEHADMQAGSRSSPLITNAVDVASVILVFVESSLDGLEIFAQEVDPENGLERTAMPEVHSNSRIQHDMELWRCVRDYDKKSSESPFLPVLTRKQKQHLKMTIVGKPYKTCSTGSHSSSDE